MDMFVKKMTNLHSYGKNDRSTLIIVYNISFIANTFLNQAMAHIEILQFTMTSSQNDRSTLTIVYNTSFIANIFFEQGHGSY